MVNPFKPGDKVLIFRKGIEMEATVRSTWNHEVQVRVADGELLWRTVKTARLVVEAKPEVVEGEVGVEPTHAKEEPLTQVAVVEPEPLREPAENIVPFPAAEEPSASFEPSGHNSGKNSRSKSRKKAKKSGKGQVRRTRKDPF